MASTTTAKNVEEAETGVVAGGIDTAQSEGVKRKYSLVSTPSSEIDLSMLEAPRPGRPCRLAAQDPAMQEARKRARVLRNRAAAQLSREKKRQHLESLEQENAELRSKNEELEERLGKTEDANAALSARLDGLSQQLQSFQSLLLGTQQRQPSQAGFTTPGLDWSAVTPLVASPLHTPLPNAQANGSAPSFSSFGSSDTVSTAAPVALTSNAPPSSNNSHSAPASEASNIVSFPSVTITEPQVSGTSLFSSMSGTMAPSTASLAPSAAMDILPTTAAASELSGKGLSESAALEQSGGHIYCVLPDSQQRRPLPRMESICRKPQELPQQSLAVLREVYSSTSSCKNWGQQMASMAVSAVVSVSARSSPQTLWTIFCVLWWIVSQSGGWVSKHQLLRIARGILELTPAPLSSAERIQRHGDVRDKTSSNRGAALSADLESLAVLAAWLGPGTRTAAALRRVLGDEPVEQVSALVAGLRTAARTANSRRQQRLRSSGGMRDKYNRLTFPP
ncbi:hypothetical protein COEREDRAFT_79171 [Coemansia reversa NRRL 1564]|uniref:BZIP domain-containing protein n=1 Tax=Coemansia reversa (strain ATCC 12441 / NRRL 1564) TaxID=763665 RepID=A0A2G5BJQ3_COERN|nr:hypothetical protein COEREDRAFT_79171 [Coemansia reversa NRRL 1564]|eukprot:PIA19211.1 hypothetical protein COEREDRAFT_79171 [Coemansia reversa NRRL 1564]